MTDLIRVAARKSDSGRRSSSISMDLPQYSLTRNRLTRIWELRCGSEVVESFPKKAMALRGRVLAELVGDGGGVVRIHRSDGRFELERRYPPRR